jgi:hypothetical protein
MTRKWLSLLAVAPCLGFGLIHCQSLDIQLVPADASTAIDAKSGIRGDAGSDMGSRAESSADAATQLDASDGSDASDGCAPSTSADTCKSIPLFKGVQTVDGLGDDFCGVPAFVFIPANERLTADPEPGNPGLLIQATVQVAWSPDPNAALHVFVHIPKWPVYAAAPPAYPWSEDAVEVLAAGSATDLTGNADASDPGATHIIIAAPPTDSAASYATNGGGIGTPLAAGTFATILDENVGYNVELEIPWSTLGSPPPSKGAKIAFDVGFDLMLPSDGGLERYQAFHSILALTGAPSQACGGFLQPSCDDRTWCTPTLE